MTALSIGAVILSAFVALFALGVVGGLLWLAWKCLKVVFWLIGRVLRFAKDEVVDTIHTVGALVTALATVPLAAANLVIFRLGSARHYGRTVIDELASVGAGLWRVALGNPLRLVGLGGLVEGVERRLPDAMERAPRARRARRATFEGYDVIGTLPSGGSGAQLFIARPKQATFKRFFGAGRVLPSEVVIKSFALEAGSTLPQIVRESRALEAASALGLVCEHQLTDDHFYYVMPYVKGEDLDRVIRTLHARGPAEGLAETELRLVLGYAIDLLDALQRFHSGGLWHKDVKPANVIVAGGRAHLVDFGLVTPLASAMTLTTHGTEYYRDPEMVRLALQGVKVHEVDGVRFDVYSAGAVLFAMLENGFPAHGNLSRITRRCPEALRWVVQRAMAEMSTRYGSVAEMRADLAAVAASADPFALRPADLPSFGRAADGPAVAAAAAYAGTREAAPPPPAPPPFAPTSLAGSHRPRRRALPAVALAAAGLFGFFFLATGSFLAFGRARSHAHERFARVSTHRSIPRLRGNDPWKTLSEREQQVVDLAQDVAEDLAAGGSVQPSPAEELAGLAAGATAIEPVRPEATPGPAGEAAPGDFPSAPRGRVLVLDDFTTSIDPRVLALLREKVTQRGFTVVGREADETAAASAVDLIASARMSIGLGRADEPETQAALQQFLDQTPDLAALILVSRARDEQEHLYRVFVRRGATTGLPDGGD